MNITEKIWEGKLDDESIIAVIIDLLKKKYMGRKGRLLWVDVD